MYLCDEVVSRRLLFLKSIAAVHIVLRRGKADARSVRLYMLARQTFAHIRSGLGYHKGLPSQNGLGRASQTYIIKLLSHRKTGL